MNAHTYVCINIRTYYVPYACTYVVVTSDSCRGRFAPRFAAGAGAGAAEAAAADGGTEAAVAEAAGVSATVVGSADGGEAESATTDARAATTPPLAYATA